MYVLKCNKEENLNLSKYQINYVFKNSQIIKSNPHQYQSILSAAIENHLNPVLSKNN
jgi:hypothetical protein